MKAHDLVRSLLKEDAEDFRLDILKRSHKFDVSALSPDGNGDDHLVSFGRDLIYEGIFRLPFQDVYLESTFQSPAGMRTIGVVGSQAPDETGVSILVAPYWLGGCECGQWHEVGGYAELKIPDRPLQPNITTVFDERVVTGYKSPTLSGRNGVEEFWKVMVPALAFFVAGVVGIQTKGTVSTTVPAPEKLNRARAKRGRPLLYEHRVVTLGRPLSSSSSEGSRGGDRLPPRVHWRRGHLRTFPCGKRVPVSPALVGVGDNPIGHEYRIRSRRQD